MHCVVRTFMYIVFGQLHLVPRYVPFQRWHNLNDYQAFWMESCVTKLVENGVGGGGLLASLSLVPAPYLRSMRIEEGSLGCTLRIFWPTESVDRCMDWQNVRFAQTYLAIVNDGLPELHFVYSAKIVTLA